jgi:hypothetical protein
MPPYMCAGNSLVSLPHLVVKRHVENVILFIPHVLEFWTELGVVALSETDLASPVFLSIQPSRGAASADPQ